MQNEEISITPGKRDEPAPELLAVVDLGSNSFRLEIGEVHGGHIRVLETLRDMLRLASGLDKKNRLTKSAMNGALKCLARFRDRLSHFDPKQVRAVATNTFRVATNIAEFLPEAEAALGFPIEVISGYEEARLIFLGTSYCLPRSKANRLIIDIGGGSTEFAIGSGHTPKRLESLKQLGCVSMSQRFFDNNIVTDAQFKNAETYARAEIVDIADDFDSSHWDEAFGSSGTAAALAEILEQNGFSDNGITPEGLAQLKKVLLARKKLNTLTLAALKPERVPVLAGGLVIMSAILEELRIPRLFPVGGALRLGAMYDLMERHFDQDTRVMTVEHWINHHRVNKDHVSRIANLAVRFFAQILPDADASQRQMLYWSGLLHSVGISISGIGFHRHSSYMLRHGDMPGFSSLEQEQLATLTLMSRGNLVKAGKLLMDKLLRAQILALRLSLILYRAHRPIELPDLSVTFNKKMIRFHIDPAWLSDHPLIEYLLNKEAAEWTSIGFRWRNV
ncbi:MAG: Ppx/GppA family phosphatase [Burkholderiales bacterium]|jgi:exopolyphosphatase/guanosine-5'-triphosphate,3'-diphosphate pyrophosphatase|nr:Ppx/GppA family phosphatase [Burkholderiales bacterium]